MTTIDVVCAIIRKEEEVFIARRKPNKSLGGFWEFPGGKVENGEDPVAALKRELLEEMDMSIAHPIYFGEHLYAYDSFTIHLIGYTCDFVSSSFQMTDHDAWAFVRLEDLNQYKLAGADWYFVDLLTT